MGEHLKILTTIKELPKESWRYLSCGYLSNRPEWYAVFETGLVGAGHILYSDKDGLPSKLIPLFHLERPPSFATHNPFLLLNGLMLREGASSCEGVIEVSPFTMSTPPFSYRYGLCARNAEDIRLKASDLEEIEKQALQNGSKLIVFLFVDDKGDLRLLGGRNYVNIPVAIRWGFDPKGLASFEEWLKILTKKRRKEIRREIRRAAKEGIETVRWTLCDLRENQDEVFLVYKEHMARYGVDVEATGGIKSYFEPLLNYLGRNLVAFAAYAGGRLFGYTICIDSDDVCYVKIGAYREGRNLAYFIASYYDTIKYAIANKKVLDFSIGSNDAKGLRRLNPVVLYASVKLLACGADLQARLAERKSINERLASEYLSLY